MSTERPPQRVYKYPLPLPMGDWASVAMPSDAYPLCVQMQRGAPFIWARITVGCPLANHRFRIAGTGHDLGDYTGRHIGSFQMADGDLVFHVFEEAYRRSHV
jgi:hypothetical protein